MTKSELATISMLTFVILCAIDSSFMADMVRAMLDVVLLGIFLIEGIVVAAKPYLGLVALWAVLWYISAKLYLKMFY